MGKAGRAWKDMGRHGKRWGRHGQRWANMGKTGETGIGDAGRHQGNNSKKGEGLFPIATPTTWLTGRLHQGEGAEQAATASKQSRDSVKRSSQGARGGQGKRGLGERGRSGQQGLTKWAKATEPAGVSELAMAGLYRGRSQRRK